MAAVWVPPGKQRFTNPADDSPLVGGQVFFYIPGTDTPKDTWSVQDQSATNDNPITLDAEGEAVIWGDGLYRQVLFDSLGNQIWDQVTGFVGGGGGSVDFASPAEVAALASTTKVISPYALGASGVLSGGGGGGNYGASKPLADYGTLDLSGVTVGGNDAAFTAAQADATNMHIYTPAGTLKTNLTRDQLTKGYLGDGSLITGPGAGDGSFKPPHYSYMASKPTTWPTQGVDGFWRGDQRFSLAGGEWKEIGPDVRTYDTTARYYESNTMPVAAWLDIYSGNSGVNAFLTSGASAGSQTITLNGPATLAWIGKTVAFSLTADGAIAETHVVDNVSGSTIHITTPLANNYTWNPGGGVTPCIFFGKRTWAGRNYIKMIHAGGGDAYGHNVRMNVNYVPKASEYHSFMAATGGQYGGDVYFNSDGVYGQFMESQLQGQTYDVTAIGFVSSLVRNNDYALDGGKFWAGMWFQSTGSRPIDAGFVLLGNYRNGMDTAFASMYETSRLTVAANPGDFVITVASVNGAHCNDTCVIGAETKTINAINTVTKQIGFTTSLAGTYAIGQFLTYPKGGAVLNMKLGQRHVWNSSLSSNARSGDPVGVFATLYGNVQGDLIEESANDGATDYWAVRFVRGATAAAPDTSRIRLRPTGFQIFGTAHTVSGDMSFTQNLNMATGKLLTLGTAAWLVFDGVNIKGTTNGGGSYSILA